MRTAEHKRNWENFQQFLGSCARKIHASEQIRTENKDFITPDDILNLRIDLENNKY